MNVTTPERAFAASRSQAVGPIEGAPIAVYGCFFLSGATSLIFEVLWSNEFVTVFGNSSYAVSIVLCAYMAGIGLGSWAGGRLADRVQRRLPAFALVQFGIGAWAALIPTLLERLRQLAPAVAAMAPTSLALTALLRFALSFAVLAIPCVLMGMTLPLLVRAVAARGESSSRRIGALYCWNTLGAALGCFSAGYWMLDTLGMRVTNLVVVAATFVVGTLAVFVGRGRPPGGPEFQERIADHISDSRANPGPLGDRPLPSRASATLLLVAFASGVATLACEVLWFRYLAFFLFLGSPAYVFSLILGVYLLGLGVGGMIYSAIAGKVRRPMRALAIIELGLAVAVLATFVGSALLFAGGPPAPLGVAGMTLLTVFPSTVLMGMAFPLLCHLYGAPGRGQGRRVGLVVAANSAGTVVGSLLPVFVLVPWLGIQRSVAVTALLFVAMAVLLLTQRGEGTRDRSPWAALSAAGLALALFIGVVPSDLCRRVFLAIGFDLARHTDILFYREGRTGTAIVTRDRVNDRKLVYINGNPEVPALYAHQLCFKMLGDLGPMLHPKPDDVLMVCFGGGIAAGATTQLPEVKSLTIVDLEASVVEAAKLLSTENNAVLQNPKTHVAIDDGRNFIMTSPRKWPVIITDSTHPKAPDSWVLYSQEFYRQVRDHLTSDGVFVQWVPPHDLSTDEYKIIVRTFQSVFPHTSLWINAGMDERGQFIVYTLLVATAEPLAIDATRLRDRLAAAPVRADLEPYGLSTVPGFLDGFVSADGALRRWVGEGPINTDDLPYTYYSTRYAQRPRLTNRALLEPMEDLRPRLTATGTTEQAQTLHRELAQRAQANRLALNGRLAEAYAQLPEDIRFQKMRQLYNDGPRYSEALATVFWDEPAGLNYVAGLGAPGRGAFDASEKIYQRILQLDPENSNALNMLGCMRSDLGDLAGAEELLSRAVRLRPKSALAHYNFGTFLLKKGNADDAVAYFQRALSLKPDYAEVEANLGTVALQQGRLDEAIACYEHALREDPDSSDVNYNLGLALSRRGRVSEALMRYDRALQLRPDDADLMNEVAWLLATSSGAGGGEGARAVSLAEQSNRLTGGRFPPALRTLAAALAAVGRFHEAIESADQAIALAAAAGRPEFVEQVRAELAQYEAGKPVRAGK